MSDTYPEEYRQEVARMNDDTRLSRTRKEPSMEIDEGALAKAAQAVGVEMWRVSTNPGAIARVAITAYLTADAVGRERVSVDRKDLERLLRIANDRGWDWNLDTPDGDHATILRVQALLTAAPPERHDAPGVSETKFIAALDRLTASIVTMQTAIVHEKLGVPRWWDMDGLRHEREQAENEAFLLFRKALTVQPDAGRDPDAADAGGG